MSEETQVNLFELAARESYRFKTTRGVVTVEDLYQMPLTAQSGFCLNQVAKDINAEIKAAEEEDFVKVRSSSDTTLTNQLNIVKHIIAHKLAEAETKRKAVEKRQQKQMLLEALAQRKQVDLSTKTAEEIEAMLAAL
jgi:hypothetical protein